MTDLATPVHELSLSGVYRLQMPPLKDLPSIGPLTHQVHSPLVRSLTAGSPLPPFDTNGYDTVYTQRVSDVNRQIVRQKVSPTAFSASDSTVLVGKYNVVGTFSDWQITLGGAGPILRMAVPVPTGTLTIEGSGATFPMDNSVCEIEVHAQYLPQPPAKNGTPSNLVLNTNSTGNPVVEVMELNFTGTAPDSGVVDLMKTGLADWFNANLVQFDYVFNVANLGATADTGAFQWLMPQAVSYAYQDGLTADTSFFAALAMVTAPPYSGQVQQINASAIPDGTATAAFSISQQQMLSQIVLPALAQSWKVAPSNFVINNDGTEIDATQNITLAGVKVGAITYTPEITQLSVVVNATEIVVTTLVHTNISPGIDSYVSNTAYLTLGLQTGADGNQYLTYSQVKPALTNHWVDTATWIIITEAIIAIIGVVAAGVATGVLEGIQLAVALIIIGIVAGLAAATPQIIAAIYNNELSGVVPNLGDLISAVSDTVEWPGGSGLTLSEVVINGALQLVGNPTPPAS